MSLQQSQIQDKKTASVSKLKKSKKSNQRYQSSNCDTSQTQTRIDENQKQLFALLPMMAHEETKKDTVNSTHIVQPTLNESGIGTQAEGDGEVILIQKSNKKENSPKVDIKNKIKTNENEISKKTRNNLTLNESRQSQLDNKFGFILGKQQEFKLNHVSFVDHSTKRVYTSKGFKSAKYRKDTQDTNQFRRKRCETQQQKSFDTKSIQKYLPNRQSRLAVEVTSNRQESPANLSEEIHLSQVSKMKYLNQTRRNAFQTSQKNIKKLYQSQRVSIFENEAYSTKTK